MHSFFLEKAVCDSPEMDIFAWRKQAAVILVYGSRVQQLLLKSINFYSMNFDLQSAIFMETLYNSQ